MKNLPAGWIRLSPSAAARVVVRDELATGILVMRMGDEWLTVGVRIRVARVRAWLAKAARTSKAVARRILETLRRVMAIEGDELDDDDDMEIGASKRERIARRRRKRRERRKRVARRFKNSIKTIVKAIAKLKILDRLRKAMRGILRSKLVSGALRGGLTAMGGAFGGPLGAMLGSGVAQGILGSQLDAGTQSASVAPPSGYAFGCRLGPGMP